MNIVYLTSEAVPFAKTGGLADVCGALPKAVAELGHDATVIMPAFASIYQSGQPIEPTNISFAIELRPDRLVGGRVLRSTLPGSEVPVYLIDQPQYFHRDGLYGSNGEDFFDNAERFIFFARAAMVLLERLGKPVDIVHCNDWQTGLVPPLMKIQSQQWRWIRDAKTPPRSIMTVHNLAYQGLFDKSVYDMIGVQWEHFRSDELEYYDQVNFLKCGLSMADKITTVSPRYSAEIRTAEDGLWPWMAYYENRPQRRKRQSSTESTTTIWKPFDGTHILVENFETLRIGNPAKLPTSVRYRPTFGLRIDSFDTDDRLGRSG